MKRLQFWIAISFPLLLLAAFPHELRAQSDRPITLVVPYTAGGGTDVVARLVSNHMSRTLSRPFIIENLGGAGGTIGNERVARAAPDGSVILINHVALLSAPFLFAGLRYDTKTAFEPVGLVNNAPMVLIGRKSIPGASPEDFVRWIKSEGPKANFAHAGIGTNTHLCAVLIGNDLGFKPSFVAYRGSSMAIPDLLGGHVDLLCDQATNALPIVEAGKLHAIAVTSKQRLDQIKDIPTTAELGMPNVNYTLWHGLYAPKGTPRATIETLNAALRKAVSDPEVVAKLKQLGTGPFPEEEMTLEGHARLFATEFQRVQTLIESLGLNPAQPK